jgi:hypothetical protein
MAASFRSGRIIMMIAIATQWYYPNQGVSKSPGRFGRSCPVLSAFGR